MGRQVWSSGGTKAVRIVSNPLRSHYLADPRHKTTPCAHPLTSACRRFDKEELEILACLQEHVRAAMLRQGEGAGGTPLQEVAKHQPANRHPPVISGASAMNSRPPVA